MGRVIYLLIIVFLISSVSAISWSGGTTFEVGVGNLSELDDVNSTSVLGASDNDVLTWNSTLQQWTAKIASVIGGTGDFSFSDYQDSWDKNWSEMTTDDLTEGTTNLYDNETWNQTRGDELYAPIGSSSSMNLTNVAFTNQSQSFNGTQTINGALNVSGNITGENITTRGYFEGQPIDGSIGSGILNASKLKTHCGCINASNEGGLDVKYPDMEIRIWNYGESIHCTITEDTITVPDESHQVYYVNSTCDIANVTWTTYFEQDLNPPNFVRIFDVFTAEGIIELIKGGSVLGLDSKKSTWSNVNCGGGGHLAVCDGIDVEENTFPEINQTLGHYDYIKTIVTSQKRTSTYQGIHLVHHIGGDWTHSNNTALNLTSCDDGTDLIDCSDNKVRRYIVYSIGWGANTKIHQLAPLDTETYLNLGDCVDLESNPQSQIIPSQEDGVAVIHHIFCAKRDSDEWSDGAWVDIRSNGGGAGASPDLSIFLTTDGTRSLTGNWNAGVWNITANTFYGLWNNSVLYYLSTEIVSMINGNFSLLTSSAEANYSDLHNSIVENRTESEAWINTSILQNRSEIESDTFGADEGNYSLIVGTIEANKTLTDENLSRLQSGKQGIIDQNLNTTDSITFGNLTISGNTLIKGNLTVIGNTSIQNITQVNVNVTNSIELNGTTILDWRNLDVFFWLSVTVNSAIFGNTSSLTSQAKSNYTEININLNNSIAGNISENNASWTSTFNKTYDDYKTNVSLNYSQLTFDEWDARWTATFNISYEDFLTALNSSLNNLNNSLNSSANVVFEELNVTDFYLQGGDIWMDNGDIHNISQLNSLEICIKDDCRTAWPAGAAGGNPFDQDLNTTQNVTFDRLTITGINGVVNTTALTALGSTYWKWVQDSTTSLTNYWLNTIIRDAINGNFSSLTSSAEQNYSILNININNAISQNITDLNNTVVHTSTDETIDGVKTFSEFPQKSGSLTPSINEEFVTKGYVDPLVTGASVRESCQVATVFNITLNQTQDIDGVTVIVGDRVLVKNQTEPRWNGIYVVTNNNWTRAEDFDSNETEIVAGAYTAIILGNSFNNTLWIMHTPGQIILNTTDLNWSLLSKPTTYEGGDGINIDGTIAVDLKANTGLDFDTSKLTLSTNTTDFSIVAGALTIAKTIISTITRGDSSIIITGTDLDPIIQINETWINKTIDARGVESSDGNLVNYTHEVFEAYNNVELTITTARQEVPFASEKTTSPFYTHSAVTNNGQVTINVGGKYKISSGVSFYITGTGSGKGDAIEINLQKDTGLGFNDIEGSRSRELLSEDYITSGADTSFETFETLSEGDIIRVTAHKKGGIPINVLDKSSFILIEYTNVSGTAGQITYINNITGIANDTNVNLTSILSGNILPRITETFNLGSSLFKWLNIFGTNIYTDNLNVIGTPTFNTAPNTTTIKAWIEDEDFEDITDWTDFTFGTYTVEESPAGQLHLKAGDAGGTNSAASKYQDFTGLKNLKSSTVEFKVKFDQLAGGFDGDTANYDCFVIYLFDSLFRNSIAFTSDSVWFYDSTNAWTKQFDATFDNVSWYTIRIIFQRDANFIYVKDDEGAWNYVGACDSADPNTGNPGRVFLEVFNYPTNPTETEVHIDYIKIAPGAWNP